MDAFQGGDPLEGMENRGLMKKTTSITLGFIMSAVIVSGCGEQRRCVDANGIVVTDEQCQEDTTGTRRSSTGSRWYYGGSRGGIGSRVSDGSFESSSRGGFGRLASFHGSGDGGS